MNIYIFNSQMEMEMEKYMWEGSSPLLAYNDKFDSKSMTFSAKGRK